MLFNDHSRLAGEHAFLSASKYSWLNYDEEKLVNVYRLSQAAALGTRIHALAAEHIRLGLKLPRTTATLNQYVNDAIGFRLIPEQVLFYSPNAFGTADAIRFDEHKNFLRIHDLKTGTSRASMDQLRLYAAFFCLEYKYTPYDIETELRIYQNDEVFVDNPEPDQILRYMDKLVLFDQIIEEMKNGSL